MAGNTFGRYFQVTTFGESHGGAVGVVVDGVPPRLPLDIEAIQQELDRRRPGQGSLTSPRAEEDRLECLSGLDGSLTLGTPLCVIVRNRDFKPEDYQDVRNIYRPSHADFTTDAKFGITAASGGGRASARETIGRVIAGAVARQILQRELLHLDVVAWVDSVHQIAATVDPLVVDRASVDASAVRCPDVKAADAMIAAISAARDEGDSLGGTVRCVVRGLPAGWGDPVFDKLDANLARALMSLPATKGIEIGTGFQAALMKGSEHNDAFVAVSSGSVDTVDSVSRTGAGDGGMPDPGTGTGKIQGGVGPTVTNHSGGIQGGISNGAPVLIRLAFKPVSSIKKPQVTITKEKKQVLLNAVPGRHDPCVLPRAVPMVEAMVWLVLVDCWMANNSLQLTTGGV